MLDKHLRYFIKLCEFKNFTRTAENLFASQSTVSKAVTSLEKELNAKLVLVDKEGFRLTKEGQLLYDFAKDVTGYYDNKEEELLGNINNFEKNFL